LAWRWFSSVAAESATFVSPRSELHAQPNRDTMIPLGGSSDIRSNNPNMCSKRTIPHAHATSNTTAKWFKIRTTKSHSENKLERRKWSTYLSCSMRASSCSFASLSAAICVRSS
jgi:hypothetical protein